MEGVYAIPLNNEFRFVHEPLSGVTGEHRRRFVGRDDELSELASRIVLSDGGAFLLTGYRGVGKSTFVNRVVEEVAGRLAASASVRGRTELVDVHLNVPRQMEPVELMFHILRGLYRRLSDAGILPLLDRALREELELSFRRTSQNIALKQASALEGGFTLEAPALRGGGGKIGLSATRSRSLEREIAYLAYDDKAAEYDLIHLARGLVRGYVPARSWPQRLRDRLRPRELPRTRLKILFIFDELDKIEDPKRSGAGNGSGGATAGGGTAQPAAGGSRDDDPAGIDGILANLKTLFTTSGICFLFVAGRGTHDRWLEDVGLGDSIYESVFSYARYLPPLWAHADRICDPFLHENAFGAVTSTAPAAAYASFKKFLAFNGRGIPRRILRKFNERVRWDGQRPVLSFTNDDVRQFRFFANLYDVLMAAQGELLGELQDDGTGWADRQRLALFYLVDWVLLRGVEEFAVSDAAAASRRLSRLIAPGEQAAPQLAARLLSLLRDKHYIEVVPAPPGEAAPGGSPPRYRLTRKRLIEMGSLAGVIEPDSAPAAPAAAAAARQFGGRYEILSALARGGMSSVYLARDLQVSRQVVIKVLGGAAADDPLAHQRFATEARVLSRLVHENIVRLHDSDPDADPPYLVLEHVEGAPLSTLIQSGVLARGPAADREAVALAIARDVIAAVSYLHQNGVLWLDAKPGNIIVTPRGRVMLIDFGAAHALGEPLPRYGVVVGTPTYISPEVLRGDAVDPRTDIYSIGVMLYQLITGELPFAGGSLTERLSDAPRPIAVPVSEAVREAIERCLELDPEKRFHSADDLLAALPEGAPPLVLGRLVAQVPTSPAAPDLSEHDTGLIRPGAFRPLPPPPPTAILSPQRPAPTAPATVLIATPAPRPRQTESAIPAPSPIPPPLPAAPPPVPEPPSATDGRETTVATGTAAAGATAAAAGATATARLVSAAGTFELHPPEMRIGRGSGNEIVIAEATVSRFHALLKRTRDGWTLIDQNSRYGTTVNDAPVTAPRLLRDHDIVGIGKTRLTFFDRDEDGAEPLPRLRQRDLSELVEEVGRVGQAGKPDELLAFILDAAIDLAHAERGFVMLAGPGGLEFSAGRTRGGVALPGRSFSISRKIPHEVFASGRERIVTDLFDDVGVSHTETVAIGIRHVLCLPLTPRSESTPRGVLYLDTRERGVLVTDEQRNGLRVFVAAAASALAAASSGERTEPAGLRDPAAVAAALEQLAIVPAGDLEGAEWRFALRMTNGSREGELADAVRLDERDLAVFLLDVSGRGPEVALLLGHLRRLLSISRHQRKPSALLAELNRELLALGLETRFAVMFYGVLDAAGRRFTYSNAGHVAPMFWRKGRVSALESAGVPLGLFPDYPYEDVHIELAPGDTIVGFTTEVVEAERGDGHEFNESTVRELLESFALTGEQLASGEAARELADAVFGARMSFGTAADAVIALALTYRGEATRGGGSR